MNTWTTACLFQSSFQEHSSLSVCLGQCAFVWHPCVVPCSEVVRYNMTVLVVFRCYWMLLSFLLRDSACLHQLGKRNPRATATGFQSNMNTWFCYVFSSQIKMTNPCETSHSFHTQKSVNDFGPKFFINEMEQKILHTWHQDMTWCLWHYCSLQGLASTEQWRWVPGSLAPVSPQGGPGMAHSSAVRAPEQHNPSRISRKSQRWWTLIVPSQKGAFLPAVAPCHLWERWYLLVQRKGDWGFRNLGSVSEAN